MTPSPVEPFPCLKRILIIEDDAKIAMALAQMVSPREPLDGFQYSTLGAAIKKVWKAKGSAMRVSDVHDLLATGRLDDESRDDAP